MAVHLIPNSAGTKYRHHSLGATEVGWAKGDEAMKSTVVKRSIIIAGRKTSVSLEDAFWNEVRKIASVRDLTLSALVTAIDSERQDGNLSSALRVFVLGLYYRNQTPSREEAKEAGLLAPLSPAA